MGVAAEKVGTHEGVKQFLQQSRRMIGSDIQRLRFAVLCNESLTMDPNQTDTARFALPQHFEVVWLL
jgi:hypothetical protein